MRHLAKLFSRQVLNACAIIRSGQDCVVSCFYAAILAKNLPAVREAQEMKGRSLVWEDSLEEEMATYSSILAWEIPWTEEPDRLQSVGSQTVGHD